MKVFTHNFNPQSNSGPNKFTRQLFKKLISEKGFEITSQEDCEVEFCLIQQETQKKKPMVLRLDGIYFNSEQDFRSQNAPIKFSYDNADAVVFQSEFNKKLTEAWFGVHKNSFVVHNAFLETRSLDKTFKELHRGLEIWSCASSWRPHKRLIENVRYYLENAPQDSVFIIAGTGFTTEDRNKIKDLITSQKYNVSSKKIVFYGELQYNKLKELYAASSTFVHLAYLDHCPNVVVDAAAHGCHIVCSSTGGTKEVVTKGTVIQEEDWDFSPVALYQPPPLDIRRKEIISRYRSEDECSTLYENIFRRLCENN
jgi:glycosyltransferase involved in cell wall biosynthesis